MEFNSVVFTDDEDAEPVRISVFYFQRGIFKFFLNILDNPALSLAIVTQL